MMTYGPLDLRLAQALAAERVMLAGRWQAARRRPAARGAPPQRCDGSDRVRLARPAPGAAGGN